MFMRDFLPDVKNQPHEQTINDIIENDDFEHGICISKTKCLSTFQCLNDSMPSVTDSENILKVMMVNVCGIKSKLDITFL